MDKLTTPQPATMWTREEAFWAIERLEPIMAAMGAHVALGGSVAYRGTSTKDLDIIIYTHNHDINVHWNTIPLKMELAKFLKSGTLNYCSGISQILDGKEVACLQTPKNKRVDFFFLK